MRLRREIINFISGALAAQIVEEGLIESDYSHEELSEKIRKVITDDLLVEDRLNDEVREILNQHSDMLDRSDVNYSEMFKMVKRRLVRERGLIL
jgi:hypothetical protein